MRYFLCIELALLLCLCLSAAVVHAQDAARSVTDLVGVLKDANADTITKMKACGELAQLRAAANPAVPGQLNQHPRGAIAVLSGAERDNFVEFYDKCVAEV